VILYDRFFQRGSFCKRFSSISEWLLPCEQNLLLPFTFFPSGKNFLPFSLAGKVKKTDSARRVSDYLVFGKHIFGCMDFYRSEPGS